MVVTVMVMVLVMMMLNIMIVPGDTHLVIIPRPSGSYCLNACLTK